MNRIPKRQIFIEFCLTKQEVTWKEHRKIFLNLSDMLLPLCTPVKLWRIARIEKLLPAEVFCKHWNYASRNAKCKTWLIRLRAARNVLAARVISLSDREVHIKIETFHAQNTPRKLLPNLGKPLQTYGGVRLETSFTAWVLCNRWNENSRHTIHWISSNVSSLTPEFFTVIT